MPSAHLKPLAMQTTQRIHSSIAVLEQTPLRVLGSLKASDGVGQHDGWTVTRCTSLSASLRRPGRCCSFVPAPRALILSSKDKSRALLDHSTAWGSRVFRIFFRIGALEANFLVHGGSEIVPICPSVFGTRRPRPGVRKVVHGPVEVWMRADLEYSSSEDSIPQPT
ncbi:hypothetical protein DIPPA_50145 [Diplonema papillatum]|nr:hypothetical protein DIPPA_50145 [Diplonema papillatum]